MYGEVMHTATSLYMPDVATYSETLAFNFYVFVQTNLQDRSHITAAPLAGQLSLRGYCVQEA